MTLLLVGFEMGKSEVLCYNPMLSRPFCRSTFWAKAGKGLVMSSIPVFELSSPALLKYRDQS